MTLQVEDDPVLLDTMMSDLKAAPPQFRPTRYWDIYEARFMRELRERGLHDFRRRSHSVLQSFGASDLAPRSGLTLAPWSQAGRLLSRRAPGLWRYADRLAQMLTRPFHLQLPYRMDTQRLRELAFEVARLRALHAGAKPLDTLEASLAGNPEDTFTIHGRTYTLPFLYYYLRYVYVHQHLPLDQVSTIVELGCGSGRQAEVLKKLYPDLTLLLFDIPPQLYVCEQYLKQVFPGQVVSYRTTRQWTTLEAVEPGRIHVLAAHQFPMVEGYDFDLFWNAASFQEMEPDVVRNYLGYVRGRARFAFLQELFEGKHQAVNPGDPGVERPTLFEDYQAGLTGYEVVDRSPSWTPLRIVREATCKGTVAAIEDSFWRRAAA